MEQLVVLLEVDTRDSLGVLYPRDIIESAVDDFNKRVDQMGGILGECGLPPPKEIAEDPERYLQYQMDRVSHITKHMWLDSSVLKAKVYLLGKYAEIAKELGWEYRGIPRALGNVNEVTQTCDSYTLITVDLALPEMPVPDANP